MNDKKDDATNRIDRIEAMVTALVLGATWCAGGHIIAKWVPTAEISIWIGSLGIGVLAYLGQRHHLKHSPANPN